jgi:hypothetical protein
MDFWASDGILRSMQTETWIERLIVNQVTVHDRRYKHDYGGVEQTTDDLVAACAQPDIIMTKGRNELPSLGQLLSMEATFESDVESALGTLQKKSLVERAGERERRGPPLEPGDYFESSRTYSHQYQSASASTDSLPSSSNSSALSRSSG